MNRDNSSHNLTVAYSCGHGEPVGLDQQTHGSKALTCTYTLGEVQYSFSKPYGTKRIAHQALYTCLQSTILAMWDLSQMWSISNTHLHMWATSYPRTAIGSNTMLSHGNSSHDHPMGPTSVDTPTGTRTNSRIMCVDLNTTL